MLSGVMQVLLLLISSSIVLWTPECCKGKCDQ